MRLYTIGFEGKSAEQFFELLKKNRVERVVDIRIYPNSADAGFASQRDLPYLLKEAADIAYTYRIDLAPTPKLLEDVHRDGDHAKYALGFTKLMEERDIPASLDRDFFEQQPCCLLCFEALADHCHRRLVAERMGERWEGIEITHL